MDDHARTVDRLRNTFPGREDAPLTLTLLRLLAQGTPVTTSALAYAAGRTIEQVANQLARFSNVERNDHDDFTGFTGLTQRRTPHSLDVDGRRLHTWCAWDTLFIPALLNATAHVRSTCQITGAAITLTVSPHRIEHAEPMDVFVTFPPSATTNTTDIVGSFCCHVHFLAATATAHSWRDAHPEGDVLDLATAFALGAAVIAPLTAASHARKRR
jgi:alkylmercury lyase